MFKNNEMYFTVGVMCRLLSVSRSGYYSWRSRPLSDRDQANQLLLIDIKRIFDEEKGRPGSSRISKRLQDEGKPDKLLSGMLEVFSADPEHICRGRTAPERLNRVLKFANIAGINRPINIRTHPSE